MNTLDAIAARRSIRRFLSTDIPRETMERILQAAIQAPSAKNRQPWKFVVVTERQKSGMMQAMQAGLDNSRAQADLPQEFKRYLDSAAHTARCMAQAPVTVLIFSPEGTFPGSESKAEQQLMEIANIQSVGAAIENMILAATDLGIGSLWICDIFFAYAEICAWLAMDCPLIAAVSFGYAAENPAPRPRKAMSDVVVWF